MRFAFPISALTYVIAEEQYNEATGLYYLRARYMDPTTGTFVSMDTYPGSTKDPVSLHRYLYANANPVMYTDPTGYFSISELLTATGIQNILTGIQNATILTKVMFTASAVCTIYDLTLIALSSRSPKEFMTTLAMGIGRGLLIAGACATFLGIVAKPLLAVYGGYTLGARIREDMETGNVLDLTMAFIEATTMIYGLTRQCFTGDTLVATKEGNKAIKDIKVGDYVYSYDAESDTRELKKVTAVFVSEKDELYSIETSEGTTIDTTEGHPFYVEGKGWTVAAELKPNDILTTADGRKVTVESITIVKLTTPVMVYNLEIEDNHTYYVSADEVLVHNMCKVRKKSGKKSEASGENNTPKNKTSLWGQEKYVTEKGLNTVKQHLSGDLADEYNNAMISRLEVAYENGTKISGADLDFYAHEIYEASMMKKGMSYIDAHNAAKIYYNAVEFNFYHPDVIKENPTLFNRAWFEFWGIERN